MRHEASRDAQLVPWSALISRWTWAWIAGMLTLLPIFLLLRLLPNSPPFGSQLVWVAIGVGSVLGLYWTRTTGDLAMFQRFAIGVGVLVALVMLLPATIGAVMGILMASIAIGSFLLGQSLNFV